MGARSGCWSLCCLVLFSCLFAVRAAGQWAQEENLRTVKVWGFEELDPWLEDEPHHILPGGSRVTYRITGDLFARIWPGHPGSFLTDVVFLPGATFDSYDGPFPEIPPELASPDPTGDGFVFVLPHYRFDRRGLEDLFTLRVHSDTTLAWTNQQQRARLLASVWSPDLFALPNASAPPGTFQRVGPYHPFYRIDASLRNAPNTRQVQVTLFRTPESVASLDLISGLSSRAPDIDAYVSYRRVLTELDRDGMKQVAHRPDLVWILPATDSDGGGPADREIWTLRRRREELVVLPGARPIDGRQRSPRIFRITSADLDRSPPLPRSHYELMPPIVEFASGAIDLDTQALPPTDVSNVGPRLHVVRLIDTETDPRQSLADVGVDLLESHYRIPSGAALAWADTEGAGHLERFSVPPGLPDAGQSPQVRFLEHHLPLPASLKIAEAFENDSPAPTDVTMYRHPQSWRTVELLHSLTTAGLLESGVGSSTRTLRVSVTGAERYQIARQPDVIALYPASSVAAPVLEIRSVYAQSDLLDRADPAIGLYYVDDEGRHRYRIEDRALDLMSPAQRNRLFVVHTRMTLPSGQSIETALPRADPQPPAQSRPGAGSLWVAFDAGDPNEAFESLGVRVIEPGHGRWGARLLWLPDGVEPALHDLVAPPGIYDEVDPHAPRYPLAALHPYAPRLRLAPGLEAADGVEWMRIEILRTRSSEQTRERIRALATSAPFIIELGEVDRQMMSAWMPVAAALEVARLPDVLSVKRGHGITSAQEPAAESTVRVATPTHMFDGSEPGIQWLARVSGEDFVRLSQSVVDQLEPTDRSRLRLESNRLDFGSYRLFLPSFDPVNERLTIASELELTPAGLDPWVVQFVAPAKPEWLESLREDGARFVGEHHLIVWATPEVGERMRLRVAPPPYEDLAEDDARFLQYVEPYHVYFRVPWWLPGLDQGEWPLARGASVVLELFHPEEDHSETLAMFGDLVGYHTGSTVGGIAVRRGEFSFDPSAEQVIDLARRADVFRVHFYVGGPSGGGGSAPPIPPAPGTGGAAVIPMASPLGLFVLAVLLLSVGWYGLRRAQRANGPAPSSSPPSQ